MWFQNLGGKDRLLRLGAAIVCGVLALTRLGSPDGPTILAVVAIWLALTSLTGYSPVYRLGHIKTTARHLGAPDHWDRY